VFRHGAFPVTHEQRLLAGVLATGPGSAVSHRAALGLHGLRGFDSHVIEVSRPTVIDQPLVGVRVHRSSDLGPEWIGTYEGLPVTTPVRTLVDLGAVARPGVVRWCMEEWLSDRVVTIDELRGALKALSRKGRSGVGVLRRVLEERVLVDLIPDSRTEVLLVEVLLAHGLPDPAFHYLVEVDGTVIAELDVAYPEQKVAIEVDGYGVHLHSQVIFEDDRQRQNELEILGWAVLRFTRHALRDRPDRVADQVRRLLRARTS
jgi:very-short-patch-repair endonuclease